MSCNYCWPGNCCGGPNCEDDMRRLSPGEIEEIVHGSRDLAVLDSARAFTDTSGTWRPHRGTWGRAEQLAKAGLLKEAGICAMPPYKLYVITDAGRSALTKGERP